MRLIDASELIQLLCINMDSGKQFNIATHCVDVMPTVDAVPIEFIRSEIKNSKGFYNSSLRRLLDAWEERKEE